MASPQQHKVLIDKLVHGGQGIGTLPDGKKALVWNVLPGEQVCFTARKSKSSFVEGVAEEVIVASKERVKPLDDLYLSTSPWQMMTYEAENKYKKETLAETIQRERVNYVADIDFFAPDMEWNYRNKMEYSFYGDDDGLHLALFNRGTHLKQIVTGSSIASPEIDETANTICKILNDKKIRASDLKSIVVRCNQAGECVAAIFTRNEKFIKIAELSSACKGLAVYFSNPKSPASIVTKKLYQFGNINLQDKLLGQPISYDVVSFFQVNIRAYEQALKTIKASVEDRKVVDMYSGVGSIGLSVSDNAPKLVEIDSHSAQKARENIDRLKISQAMVVEAPAEKALEHIPAGGNQTVIFDPPRAGLHAKVTQSVLEKTPGQVIYLSCNPSTLARDLKLLESKYKIVKIDGYNFFPRTPHIEALAILESNI